MKLSDKVRDQITGFEGIITGKCSYINGCVQFLVQPTVDKEGSHRGAKWIDQTELAMVKANATEVGQGVQEAVGGPHPDAPSIG